MIFLKLLLEFEDDRFHSFMEKQYVYQLF